MTTKYQNIDHLILYSGAFLDGIEAVAEFRSRLVVWVLNANEDNLDYLASIVAEYAKREAEAQ